MSDYQRKDGLTARTDTSTPCRCGRGDCEWTEADDRERDRIEWVEKWGPTEYPDLYPDRHSEPRPAGDPWAERKAIG